MKKEIRVVKDNIIQITTVDERFYIKSIPIFKDDIQIDTEYKTVPAISWIASFYPKGIAFWKFLANHGWDESQAIKESAGNKGSRVHLAIADLIAGLEVGISSKYLNQDGKEEALTAEEYFCVMTFVDWFNEVKPEIHANEEILFSDRINCAGTLDLYCTIKRLVSKESKATKIKEAVEAVYVDEKWIVDFKTGASIWPEHHIQLSGYKQLKLETFEGTLDTDKWPEIKLGILQLGYKKNKKAFKFTEIPYNYDMFEATQKIWANETAGIQPKQIDYPISLCLNKEAENVESTTSVR